MVTQLQHPSPQQTAHLDFAESLKQAVIEQTDNGRRIIQSVSSIMDGNAPNCTPWHQLEAAKLLHKLGIGNPPKINPPSPINPPLPQGEGWGEGAQAIQGGVDATADHMPLLPAEEGWNEGQSSLQPVHPVSLGPSMTDEQAKLTKKLIRQIRVHTGDGASIVRFLVEIMEGEDPTTKGRDRLEAIKMLLGICLDSPVFPDPEFMLQSAPCHPDCLCVCKDLPEDHPEVAKMHTPLTAEQREQSAKQQARQEEWDRETDELIERKKRADKQWKLEQFHSPEAADDRRLEREEQRKRRSQKREQEKERKRELREPISRETRFDTWQYHQQEIERQKEKERQRNRDP